MEMHRVYLVIPCGTNSNPCKKNRYIGGMSIEVSMILTYCYLVS